jgi:hypothetical protein
VENFVSNYIKFKNLGSMINIFLKMFLSGSLTESCIAKESLKQKEGNSRKGAMLNSYL